MENNVVRIIPAQSPNELPRVYYAYLPDDKRTAEKEAVTFFAAKFGEVCELWVYGGVYCYEVHKP